MTGATITVPSQIDKLDMKAYLAEDDWCYQDGCVTKQPRRSDSAKFPAMLPLNTAWGALIGAYLLG